ncbi:hypothetical protein ACHHYP_01757 [Achlya hypogyna]|uniref:Ankyrin repeat protein n=1 Tax=Achlya hypogyna TaxID=1202772 RepID=A0A1V9ZTA4_ACHHY|nr:hypothetical protein ACHHYP_01757 [Achlya hypogyna]
MATCVLRNRDFFLHVVQYQHGLPLEVRQVVALAAQVVITPLSPMSYMSTMARLNNIPLPYADVEYVRRVSDAGSIPNYALFFHNQFVAPALPLHLAIVAGNLFHVERLATWQPTWVSSDAVALAAICGQLRILQYLATLPNGCPTAAAMDLAAMNGYLNVVEWLHGLPDGPGCTTQAMDGAAAFGHLNVVAFLHEQRTEGCTYFALAAAVRKGHASVVDFLLSIQPSTAMFQSRRCSKEFYRIPGHRSAPGSDLLRTIQVLKAHNAPADICNNVVHTAIASHGYDAIQLLHESGIRRIDQEILDTVVTSKDRASIDYALRQILIANDRWPLNSLGNLGSLWDLHEDLPWDPWQPQVMGPNSRREADSSKAMDIAACLGDLPTVKLLHHLRLDCCSSDAMNHACARGHLNVAQWLHAHRSEGCTKEAMLLAAVEGHKHVVEWLHSSVGMPCSEDVLANAAKSGDIAMLTYLLALPMVDGDTPSGGWGSSCTAFLPDGCVEYIIGSYAVDIAAANGHIDAVQLLQLHEASTIAMDQAASNGHLDVVAYLHAHRTEGCTADAFDEAIFGGHDDVLEFLITHYATVVTDWSELFLEAAKQGRVTTMNVLWTLLSAELTPTLAEKVVTFAASGNHVDLLLWLIKTKGIKYTKRALREAARRGHNRLVQL